MSLIILDSAATGGTTYTVNLSDTVSVTDSLTASFIGTLIALLSDTLSLSDVSIVALDYGKAGSDTTTVTDSSGTSTVYLRSESDTISVSDTIVTDTSYIRITGDTVVVSDTIAVPSGFIFTEVIGDTIIVVDTLTIPGLELVSISETITVTDLVVINGAAPTPPIVIVVGLPKDPNLLERLLLKIAENPPSNPLQAAQAYTGAYEQFAHILAPTPITVGRRILFENTLLPLFSGGPSTPPQFINTMIQGFTNYWIGMPV